MPQPSACGRVLLALADSKYFCSAVRANALGGRLLVLHGDGFGVLYFLLGPAFHAVCLHLRVPLRLNVRVKVARRD